jgi:hypothetical protein
MSITTEIKSYCQSIAKRVYPETEREKNCINEYGKMIVRRGHFTKELINFISKYDGKTAENILESGKEQGR